MYNPQCVMDSGNLIQDYMIAHFMEGFNMFNCMIQRWFVVTHHIRDIGVGNRGLWRLDPP